MRVLPAGRLCGTVRIPGSKSYTNRALVAAALSNRDWTLRNPLDSDDTRTLALALAKLGAVVSFSDECWHVAGTVQPSQSAEPVIVDIGPAGTPARFLLALCSAVPGLYILDGTPRMRQRPMGDLVEALRQLGAQIDAVDREGFLPLRIEGRRLRGGRVRIDGGVSSQFISALLLMESLLDGPLSLEVLGRPVSGAYVDMTRETLAEFEGGSGVYEVPGDDSAACFFLAGAALSSGTVRLQGLRRNSIQPDSVFRSWAAEAGAIVDWQDGLLVVGPAEEDLRPLAVNVDAAPDAALPLAALLAFAQGTSRLGGTTRLKDKESDRLAAARDLLSRVATGTASDEKGSYLTIDGSRSRRTATSFYAHDDHRVAMSAAVLALRCEAGSTLSGAECVSKSFPRFFEMWGSLIEPVDPSGRA